LFTVWPAVETFCATRAVGGQVGEHHGELVAADARHRVCGAHHALHALRHLAKQRVARRVAEPVVHQLEVVQVDEQHAEQGALALRLRDHLLEAVGEQRAVGEPGHRIELREVREPALAVDALQAGGEQAGGRAQEAELVGPVRVAAPCQRAQRAAHRVVAPHRDHCRAAELAPPGERQVGSIADERLAAREGRLDRLARNDVHQLGVVAAARAQHQLAGLLAGLKIGHGIRAQPLDHGLDRFGDQLVRLAPAERRLTEARERLLVAHLRRLALVGGLALGEVARIDHQNRALRHLLHRAPHLDRERAAVLAAVDGDRRVRTFGARHQILELAVEHRVRRVDADLARAAPEQLLARIAEVAAHALVEIDEPAPPDVHQQHHVGRGVERHAEALQRGLGLLAALLALANREAQALRRARSRCLSLAGRDQEGRDEVHAPRIAGQLPTRSRPYKNWP
jgi:hypothetical protein